MLEKCERCEKALAKYKELIKTADGIFEAADDFKDFVENCKKTCRKRDKKTDNVKEKYKEDAL